MTAVLSTAYFPNVEYFSILAKYDSVLIETQEHYLKQTYRNRCTIQTANGLFNLIVPVNAGSKTNIKDVKISYIENWRHQHKIAIMSAYGSAPFYEYYCDVFEDVFSKKFDFLFDINMYIVEKFMKFIGLTTKLDFTQNFCKTYNNDYRYLISPKKQSQKHYGGYIQVFSNKFDFVPNLSIIDLLLNLGGETKSYLVKSVVDLNLI